MTKKHFIALAAWLKDQNELGSFRSQAAFERATTDLFNVCLSFNNHADRLRFMKAAGVTQ